MRRCTALSLVLLAVLNAGVAAGQTDATNGERKVSALQRRPYSLDSETAGARSKDGPWDAQGSFYVDLGAPAPREQVSFDYVVEDLPANCAVGLGWLPLRADGTIDRSAGVDLARDLGIEKWSAEWRNAEQRLLAKAECDGVQFACALGDPKNARAALTAAGERYGLTVRLVKSKVPPAASDKRTVRLILIGIPMPELAAVPDARPKAERVADHGKFTLRENWLDVAAMALKVGEGRSLSLGRIDVAPGVTHRFHLAFETGGVLGLGFVLPGFAARQSEPLANDELFRQAGVRKMHIHMETATGLVLISDEFDTSGSTLPIAGYLTPTNWSRLTGGRSPQPWRFQPNTASGTSFVPCADDDYVLELTVTEVEERNGPRPQLRPMIKRP